MSDNENDGGYDNDNVSDEIGDEDLEQNDIEENGSEQSKKSKRSLDTNTDNEEDSESENEKQNEDEDNSKDQLDYDIIIDKHDKFQQQNEKKITPPFLTKYEKARIIGTRALQISKNSPVYVEIGQEDYDPIAIAEKEFQEGKIPFVIRRYLPNKSFEDWPLSELTKLD